MSVNPGAYIFGTTLERGFAVGRSRIVRPAALALGLFTVLSVTPAALSAQKGDSHMVTPGKTVVLTPDSCASVADGDIVTFQWNPAFSSPVEIPGLHDFSMVFAPAGKTLGKSFIPQGGFELRALPAKATPEVPVPVADAHNGFLTFSFHAKLKGIQPGQYNLIHAVANPELTSGSPQAIPQMTNSPLQYPFCLLVAGSPVGKP